VLGLLMIVSAVLLVRLVFLMSALMLLLLSAVAWSRRGRAPEAALVTLMSICAAIYCFGASEEVAQVSLDSALFWMHVQYLGISWLPALWVLLARKHQGRSFRIWLLLAIPLIAFVGQLTNSLHGLFYSSVSFQPRPPFWVVVVDRGPISWLFLAYLYGACFYGAWIYISKFNTSRHLFRAQSFLFAFSSLPPLAGYFIYLCGWSPWNLDPAPFLLAMSVLMAFLAVIEFEFFDLVPKARSLVFNNMRDAVVVTDLQFRLIEFNSAARALLPRLGSIKRGTDATAVLCEPYGLEQVFSDPSHKLEIQMRVEGEIYHFEVQALPLSVNERQFGWAVLLSDVTDRTRLLQELRRDAQTDELTGVANRRCFVGTIETEYQRAIRHETHFSVIILDLDHFKDINDRYGHVAGDRALSGVVARIVSCLRKIDLISRYGGDEFAILLPETGAYSAFEVAERIREAVSVTPVEADGNIVHLTASLGISTHDPEHSANWVQLLDEADQAMYRAKAEGQNRVARFGRSDQSSPAS
jgi:diguanylate cyclase (GGDEF)-like protein